jgi:hypothetical protein
MFGLGAFAQLPFGAITQLPISGTSNTSQTETANLIGSNTPQTITGAANCSESQSINGVAYVASLNITGNAQTGQGETLNGKTGGFLDLQAFEFKLKRVQRTGLNAVHQTQSVKGYGYVIEPLPVEVYDAELEEFFMLLAEL